MELIDLYPNYYVENKEFDCKARLNRENTLSWLKTINGFANGSGGTLFLGVEDKSLKLIGYDQKELDKEKLFFYNEIKNHSAVVPSYLIDTIPYSINGTTRYIIKIVIIEAINKPCIIKYDGMPMIYIRRDGFTNPATEEEIRMMVLNSNRLAFDTTMTDIDFDFNDFKKLSLFYKERTNKELTIKDLESIKFVVDGKLSNGAYLFKDDYSGKRTKVVCSLYRGISRGDNVIVSSNTFEGNLIDCYYYINDFIKSRMNQGFIKLIDRRVDVNSYPDRAIFEAIINALAHRDYLLDGTQINVDMFANRLSISTPGSLFETKYNLEPTYDLTSFSSKRRNELICDVFVLAKAMEAKGTGFEKIAKDYMDYDKLHQPYIYSKNNTFFIVLPDLTNEEGVSIDSDSIYITETIKNQTRFDVRVLSYCFSNKRSVKEIIEHLDISNSTFFRKNVLDNLVSQGFLTEIKNGNTSYYLTNPNIVKFR